RRIGSREFANEFTDATTPQLLLLYAVSVIYNCYFFDEVCINHILIMVCQQISHVLIYFMPQ
ncbi:hypothetical protein, partial [Erwinia tracheiphila]|uniref:hypothetical protein n=1 Tax=Erwinia tracheiphila TaxID=65700 RepID=UPI001E5DFDAC